MKILKRSDMRGCRRDFAASKRVKLIGRFEDADLLLALQEEAL
jgi:hypothetical protein